MKTEKTWWQYFKKLLCLYFWCGHKWESVPGVSAMQCERCNDVVWNVAGVLHKAKKMNKNRKWGKNYFRK